MTRCLFGDGFSSRNEGRWDGRLGLPLTSISLHTLSSNLFYPPPLLLPSSPLLSYIDRRNPSPTLPAVTPYLSRPRPYKSHSHTRPISTLRPLSAATSLYPLSPNSKHLAQSASHRPPVYIRTHLLGVLFLGTTVAPQIDIHASTPRQRWVF